jgi:thiol-disulfide isomerase/thioredoxin
MKANAILLILAAAAIAALAATGFLAARVATRDATADRLEPLFPIPAVAAAATAPHLPDLGAAPEFTGLTEWINGPPRTLASMRGRVVLVKFWAFQCINCEHTLAATRGWYDRYHALGLEIVAVHTPELADERVPANVRAAVRADSIPYPVALDPAYSTWKAWDNHAWPAFYLVDARGHVRYTRIGEGGYGETERAIQELLAAR